MVTLPRPHRLYVQQSTPVGTSRHGFDLPPLTEWRLWCTCREQPLGQSRELEGKNGKSYRYSSLVFVDVDTPEIETGALIEVRESDGRIRLSGEVKRFSRDMMHARIWV
jgi:hypothetical protein